MGRGFQAEIPLLHEKRHADVDSHNALQLWSAWEEMDLPVNQQRGRVSQFLSHTHRHTFQYFHNCTYFDGTCLVEALLLMARSSVVPGGGTSPEASLYILRQCRGDFLVRTRWHCCCCSCCCCCCLSPQEDEIWVLSFSWQLRSCCRLLKPTTAATTQANSTNVHTHTFISMVLTATVL